MRGSHGTFYWNELMTRDVERAKKFYADTMGWSYEAMPMPAGGTYWLAKMGGEPVAGIFDISGREYARFPKAGCPISRSMTSMLASKKRSRPAPRS